MLRPYQQKAIDQLHSGSILCCSTGGGKSRTGLAYYICKECGAELDSLEPLPRPVPLYVITTAKKRDSKEWEEEFAPFHLVDRGVNPVVDSWNNIGKYDKVEGAFFLFDEQRVVGSGAWVKAFLKIAKHNHWILLTATPGDTWLDYVPVFIANGFYKNRTDFYRQHVLFSRFSKYPKVDHYVGGGTLLKHRRDILVRMDYRRKAVACHEYTEVPYSKERFLRVLTKRWDIWNDCPIQDAAGVCYALRRVVNEDDRRVEALHDIYQHHPKLIVFYNFNYELALLRKWAEKEGLPYTEWNGFKHEEILAGEDRWAYFVQYTAGAEGWNCTLTDTIVFYSQNYSYKTMAQAAGRTDRMNTPFVQLYYYHLISKAPIDIAIRKALNQKRNFNEKQFLGS